MERTFHYFNCFITKNGLKTNIPFSLLLDRIITLNEDQKYREIKQGAYSLIKMQPPAQNLNDANDRVVCFGNYRAKKPFLGNRRSDRLDEIIDDVVESTTCFYQHTNNLLVTEYNHYGARPKHIENYLSNFLPKDETTYWDIELVEIEPEVGIADVRDSRDIRSIIFKLDLSTAQRNMILREEAPESIIANVLHQTVEAQYQIGGNVASIGFGNGRKGDNHLEPAEIVNILNILDLESDLYESVKVRYQSPALGKVHQLDLKNAGVLKKTIDLEGDSWEAIGDALQSNFYNEGRTGQNHHRRFSNDIIYENLPDLQLDLALQE
ncbi:DUF6731 family protein [Fictibacillus phosphorivorans]|uniref:DUF6731 family protein n=1 Tax=Fictibacillus phosphorivorans TaxID=1221500 RepID=UPI003CF53B74